VSPEELYEQATGKRYAPAVDWSQADPEYLFQAATTGRPVEDIRDAALERARQGDQARTSGQFAQGAVSRFFERQLGGFKPGGESTHEMLGREVVPLARGRLEGGYREARRRFDAAQASDQDLALIARYEAIQRTEQGESTWRPAPAAGRSASRPGGWGWPAPRGSRPRRRRYSPGPGWRVRRRPPRANWPRGRRLPL
jgi:hypothetical protein